VDAHSWTASVDRQPGIAQRELRDDHSRRRCNTLPAAGRLIDVGGYRPHLDCQGDGSPTVILVTGLDGSSLLWQRMQPALA